MNDNGGNLTARARAVLSSAGTEAERLGSQTIGTEHLLLALLADSAALGTQAVANFVDVSFVREYLLTLINPQPDPRFPDNPRPWSSGLVHDSKGRPLRGGDGRALQYFIDREGQEVRSASGRLVHAFFDEEGKIQRNSDGRIAIKEISIPENSFDWRGRPLI